MKRLVSVILLGLMLSGLLGACGATPEPKVVLQTVEVEKVVSEEVVVTATPESEPVAAEPPMAYEAALACVKELLPAEAYMTNDYLPDPIVAWKPLDCQGLRQVKVGMPWVLNDEEAPWYNALELGYYEDVCLEVELVPGGPGTNHIQTLGGGAIEIAVTAGGQAVPAAVASVTPIDIVAIGTFLKGMPYCFISINEDLLNRRLTPLDLIDQTLAVQQGSDVYAQMMLDKYGIPREKVKLIDAGFTPDVLLVGEADFYAGWVVNQPRLIEQQGKPWNAIMYRDWVYDEYSDVMVVRRQSLVSAEDQEMIRRFLGATYQGLVYLLEHPEESAEIAVKYGVEAQVSREQALWRFAQQRELIIGRDGLGLMAMSPDKWNEELAILVQYGEIEIGCQP